ncbi:MAG: hypothetical protein AB7F79_04975 [Steroidobacteraceae bacterium]
MSNIPVSPYQTNPPSSRRLLLSVLAAMVLAAVVLLVAILPAEYGIDPTGMGRTLGLTQMSQSAATKKIELIELIDTLSGNEKITTVEIPEVGQPLPLPNPAVHQAQTEPAKSETLSITLQPEEGTEIKAALSVNKMMLYSWKVDRGGVYVDFHGHDPAWTDKQAFVRYEEKDAGTGGNGSLVAPFTGEHGWYWLNYNEFPVVITLTVSGYYDKMINYQSGG